MSTQMNAGIPASRARPHGRPAARRRRVAMAATAAVPLLLCGPAGATLYQWDVNAGGSYTWSNASNWSGNGVPNDPTGNGVVVFEDGSVLTGTQTIAVANQACGELLIGDLGGVYRQVITSATGTSSPDLRMGTSGGTALIYPDGGNSYPAIAAPLVLASCNLHVESYYQTLSGNTNPNTTSSENLSINNGISGCVNLEVTHATLDIGNTTGMTGGTTLDGGYAVLSLDTSNDLPTTTAVTIADATDTLHVDSTIQEVASLAGTGTVNFTGGTLRLDADNTTFAGTLNASSGGLLLYGGRLSLTGTSPGFNGYMTVVGSSLSPTTLVANGNLALGTATSSGISLILNGGTLETTASFTLTHEIGIANGLPRHGRHRRRDDADRHRRRRNRRRRQLGQERDRHARPWQRGQRLPGVGRRRRDRPVLGRRRPRRGRLFGHARRDARAAGRQRRLRHPADDADRRDVRRRPRVDADVERPGHRDARRRRVHQPPGPDPVRSRARWSWPTRPTTTAAGPWSTAPSASRPTATSGPPPAASRSGTQP